MGLFSCPDDDSERVLTECQRDGEDEQNDDGEGHDSDDENDSKKA